MDSNRLRLAAIREVTLGTTPSTPKMRTARITGESLKYTPQFVTSDEIRADRMNADPVQVNQTNSGGINYEFTYPASRSFLSEAIVSAMQNDWTLAPEWDNVETTSSIATTTSTTTITVVDQSALVNGFAGSSVKAGHLVRLTGFTSSGNNSIFKVASSTATTIVTAGLTNETVPATARVKVIGFEGASADITATATGLASTALNFTLLGLTVGGWVKIGGGTTGQQFATAANNGYARITAIAATALTLDNLPTGWGVDAGTGKTVRAFFGDVIKNGTTLYGLSIERGFLGQSVPTYILQKGMCVGGLRLDYASERIVGGSLDFMGMSGVQGTSAYGTSYTAQTTATALSANVSVGRIAEAGVTVTTPNWIRSAGLVLNNNLRMLTAVGNVGAVDIGSGECDVTISLETYFGSNALLIKLLAGTPTSVNLRATQNSQAMIWDVPRVTLTDGSPSAGAKNQDVLMPLSGKASYDSTTGAHLIANRLEFIE